MGEWAETSLQALLKFGNGKSRPKNEGTIPVYGGNGILGYSDQTNYDGNIIVIGRVGAYCGATYFEDRPIWVSDNALSARAKDGHDPKFLYYHLKNLGLNHFAEGSSHPLVTHTLLNAIDTSVPKDPFEQKAIAEVLSSLDDKIDLLHRQNKTLECLAETLFRNWFIDGAQDDWELGALGDLIELRYGKALKDSDRSGSGFPVVGSSGIVGYHSEALIQGPGLVTGRKGTLGVATYLETDFHPIDTTFYIVPQRNAGLGFAYYLLKTLDFKELNTDSAVPGLNRDIAHGLERLLPPDNLIRDFNEISTVNISGISKNRQQIANLEKLRNALLPKLISGEVRVEYEAAV